MTPNGVHLMCDVRIIETRGWGFALGPARLDLFIAWLRKSPGLRRQVLALHRRALLKGTKP